MEQNASRDDAEGAEGEKTDAADNTKRAQNGTHHAATARNTSEEPKSESVTTPTTASKLREPKDNEASKPIDKNRELEKVLYIPWNEVTIQMKAKPKPSFGLVDFLVYATGLWYFFVHLTIGPIIRTQVSKRLWLAEMGRLLYFYNEDLDQESEYTEKFEYKSDKKVKIQID